MMGFFAVFLLLLPFLDLTTYCATADPTVIVPPQKTIRLIASYSASDVMRHELRRLEQDDKFDSFETAHGALSAKLVMLSRRYVARLSESPFHVVEANQFDTLIRTAEIEKVKLDDVGFKLCLPFSVMLVADPADTTGAKTTASIVFMPRAQGSPLHQYLLSTMDDRGKADLLSNLGRALAKFQSSLMRFIEGQYLTGCHGDFHSGNITGALQSAISPLPSKWLFSLIDCGGMSVSGINPLMDPLYFIYRANYGWFSNPAMSHNLFSLTKSFYRGYLGNLDRGVGEFLRAQLPTWRKSAALELAKTKGLMFFDESLPGAKAFLDYFTPIHQLAATTAFWELGYVPLYTYIPWERAVTRLARQRTPMKVTVEEQYPKGMRKSLASRLRKVVFHDVTPPQPKAR